MSMVLRLSRRRTLAALALAALALGATGASALASRGSAAEAPPPVIRLAGQSAGYGKPYGTMTVGILAARHLLEDAFGGEGTRVEWQFPTGTGPAINEALANGQADFANYGGLPNILGRSAGLKTRILASYGVGIIYVAARKGAGIARVADLKGRRVAVARGTINQLSMARILADSGLTERDLQLFDLKAPDQVAALSSGDVDAAFGSSNFLELRDQGVVDIVYDNRDRPRPSNFFGSFLVTEAFAARYPETTQRVVDGFVQAAHWASLPENREQGLDLWALSGIPRRAVAEDAEGMQLKERVNPLIDEFYLAQMENGARFALENRLARKPIELGTWIDRSYLDRSLGRLGLKDFWTARGADGEGRT